jgi:hypothetical protein
VSEFTGYEREVVRELVSPRLPEAQIIAVLDSASLVSYEHTGVGYFLTVRHSSLPNDRAVCNKPILIGSSDDYEFGFVVFLENGELTLECHSWGGASLPDDLRARDVRVRPASQKGRCS